MLRLGAVSPERRAAGLHWSVWRRRHQASARDCHIARRTRSHPPPTALPSAVIIPLPGVPPLTQALTGRLLALLPLTTRRGRPRVDPQQMLGGMVWVMRSGRSWRELPPRFGPWATVASRYRLWLKDGTWTRIAAVLTAVARDTTL